jgi:ERCC4-type nuclease
VWNEGERSESGYRVTKANETRAKDADGRSLDMLRAINTTNIFKNRSLFTRFSSAFQVQSQSKSRNYLLQLHNFFFLFSFYPG